MKIKPQEIVVTLPHDLPSHVVDFCKRNKAVLVALAGHYLDEHYPSYLAGRLPIREINDSRYVVRTEGGSSSERGLGRKDVDDKEFPLKFDFYLIPIIHDESIQYWWAEKEPDFAEREAEYIQAMLL